jgi:hypothetical protein
MTARPDSIELLRSQEPSVWDPANVAEVVASVARPTPPELEQLLRRASGASAAVAEGEFDVFDLDAFQEVNTDDQYRGLPAATFFGSDGGDGFFFLDSDGSLGEGKGAVFLGDRGSMTPGSSKLCARDLPSFLHALKQDPLPWTGAPNLQKRQIGRMRTALSGHADAWSAGGAASPRALLDARDRLGVNLPLELETLLGIANGLKVPRAGVSLLALDAIQPMGINTPDGFPAPSGSARTIPALAMRSPSPDGAILTAAGWFA